VGSPSVFISYAREDQTLALRLFDDLVRRGIESWIDAKNLVPGMRWQDAIKAAIRESTHFVALLSSTSIRKRGYVQAELKIAFEVLDEIPPDEIFVVPVRVDECTPPHPRLSELHWADLFPSYEAGLAKIIRAIRIGQTDQNADAQVHTRGAEGAPDGNGDSHAVIETGDRCPHCYLPIDATADFCEHCGQVLESPNVRVAHRQRAILHDRYESVVASLIAGGHTDTVEAFLTLVHKAAVVMTTNESSVIRLLTEPGARYHRRPISDRVPDSTSWGSSVRAIVDEVLFPGYGYKIVYAALSPTGAGLWRYGPVALHLNENFIARRSSILDGTAAHLVNKMALSDIRPALALFTSTFADRDKLAVVKVADRIGSATTTDELGLLLQRQGSHPGGDDFMEVAIYGPVTRECIRAIRLRTSGVSIAMREVIRQLAREASIEYSEVEEG
jgi:hypothetical protein